MDMALALELNDQQGWESLEVAPERAYTRARCARVWGWGQLSHQVPKDGGTQSCRNMALCLGLARPLQGPAEPQGQETQTRRTPDVGFQPRQDPAPVSGVPPVPVLPLHFWKHLTRLVLQVHSNLPHDESAPSHTLI